MANHKSAEKRYRQSLKRRSKNQAVRSTVRTAIKKTRLAISEGKATEAQTLFKAAEKAIARATAKGIYHKNNSSRKISRLHKLVSKA
jgi:small subunit ribosomal protein S20